MAGEAALKAEPEEAGLKAEPEEAGLARWKKRYMWMTAGQEMNKWRSELRDLSAHTGLPTQTEWVLRY